MRSVFLIANTTYKESVRSKVLYSTLFFLALIVVVSSILGSVTIGDRVMVVKSFGISAISLFSVGYALIAGSILLQKELVRKTIHNILSKPVHRWEFLVGKFLGMFMTSALVAALMAAGLVGFVFVLSGNLSVDLFIGLVFIILELAVVCSVTILFSSFVETPMLTGLFSAGVFLAGRSSSYIERLYQADGTSFGMEAALKGIYWGLPHLDSLYLGDKVIYGFMPTATQSLWAGTYAVGYAGVLLSLATILFKRKEFK